MHTSKYPQRLYPRHEHGIVLLVSLVILLMLTLLGLAVMNMSTLQERIAGNATMQNRAFQGAESALANVVSSVVSSTANLVQAMTPSGGSCPTVAITTTPADGAVTASANLRYLMQSQAMLGWGMGVDTQTVGQNFEVTANSTLKDGSNNNLATANLARGIVRIAPSSKDAAPCSS